MLTSSRPCWPALVAVIGLHAACLSDSRPGPDYGPQVGGELERQAAMNVAIDLGAIVALANGGGDGATMTRFANAFQGLIIMHWAKLTDRPAEVGSLATPYPIDPGAPFDSGCLVDLPDGIAYSTCSLDAGTVDGTLRVQDERVAIDLRVADTPAGATAYAISITGEVRVGGDRLEGDLQYVGTTLAAEPSQHYEFETAFAIGFEAQCPTSGELEMFAVSEPFFPRGVWVSTEYSEQCGAISIR